MINFKIDSIKNSINKITQNKNFSSILIVALFSLIALDILFIFIPEIRLISKLNSKNKNILQKLNQGKQELMNLDKLNYEFENKAKELDLKRNYFAREEDLAILIEEIFNAASEAEIKINQIKPLREEKPQKIQKGKDKFLIKIPISVLVVCDYHSLGRFISRIETANKFFNVSVLEIKQDPLDYKNSNATMSIVTLLETE